jgi:hypothetical protein
MFQEQYQSLSSDEKHSQYLLDLPSKANLNLWLLGSAECVLAILLV